MKILIYGAGVLGCELAHELIRAGQDVTLLARGEWKRTLAQNGLVIRHWAQLRSTVDRPKLIDTLPANDRYDLIFVVMRFSQLDAVLPALQANVSKRIVLVGNNTDAERFLRTLTDCEYPKEVAFAFQGTAGHREKGRVVSVHLGTVGMTIGALNGYLSTDFQSLLTQAAGSRYRLTWETHMDAWLKCHAAFILSICYLCYTLDGKLSKANKAAILIVMTATQEAHAMLNKLGYPIRPDGEETYFTTQQEKSCRKLLLMAKTPIGRLTCSDHAMNAKDEMSALDASFEALRQRADTPMPAWNSLRTVMSSEQVVAVFGILHAKEKETIK